MPILPTYLDYSSGVDPITGKYRVIWEVSETGEIIMASFNSLKPLIVLERFFDNVRGDRSGIVRLVEFLDEDETTLKEAIAYIRIRPTLTLAQWNTYLNTLTYEKRAIIRSFLHKLAIALTIHYGLILSNYTETEILQKTRNWICTINIDILKRVCFGYLINL